MQGTVQSDASGEISFSLFRVVRNSQPRQSQPQPRPSDRLTPGSAARCLTIVTVPFIQSRYSSHLQSVPFPAFPFRVAKLFPLSFLVIWFGHLAVKPVPGFWPLWRSFCFVQLAISKGKKGINGWLVSMHPFPMPSHHRPEAASAKS
jgi:hypothetical protein